MIDTVGMLAMSLIGNLVLLFLLILVCLAAWESSRPRPRP